MAVATVVEILKAGGQIGFELDSHTVVWGDARKVRNAISRCGLRVGDVIDYQLEDSGELAGFRLANEQEA